MAVSQGGLVDDRRMAVRPRQRTHSATAVVLPNPAGAVTKGKAAEWGRSVYTPVIVKYRDEKTDKGVELEDLLR